MYYAVFFLHIFALESSSFFADTYYAVFVLHIFAPETSSFFADTYYAVFAGPVPSTVAGDTHPNSAPTVIHFN